MSFPSNNCDALTTRLGQKSKAFFNFTRVMNASRVDSRASLVLRGLRRITYHLHGLIINQ
jgi:hypothetical protein